MAGISLTTKPEEVASLGTPGEGSAVKIAPTRAPSPAAETAPATSSASDFQQRALDAQKPLLEASLARTNAETEKLRAETSKLITPRRRGGRRRGIQGAKYEGSYGDVSTGGTGPVAPRRNLQAETTRGSADDPNSLTAKLGSSSTARIAGEQKESAARIASAGRIAQSQAATIAADLSRKPAAAPAMDPATRVVGTMGFEGRGKAITTPAGKTVGSSFVPNDPAGYGKAAEIRNASLKKQTARPWETASTVVPVRKPQIQPAAVTAPSVVSMSTPAAAIPAVAAAPSTAVAPNPSTVAANPGVIPGPSTPDHVLAESRANAFPQVVPRRALPSRVAHRAVTPRSNPLFSSR